MNPRVSATQTTCFHCGDPCPNLSVSIDDKYFCCQGCRTVFELLSANRLGKYYDLESSPGAAPKGQPADSTYAYLDDPRVVEKLVEFTDQTRTVVVFSIPQIHCSSCIWLLERLHRFDHGILDSRVDFPRKLATITFDPNQVSLRSVAELLKSIGYEPSITLDDLSEQKDEQRFHRERERRVLRSLYGRLAVAGFCFGNVMLFSFPEYFSINRLLEAEFARFFDYLNLLLTLPVLLYSSAPFISSAYHGLKSKFINMDVPITVGILALFVRSATEILIAGNAGYADSFTGLVFFLLIGKVYQRKTYDALSFDRDFKSYFPVSATVRKQGTETTVPVTDLKPGDTLVVRNGELIPADAVLIKGSARIDYSFVTGEADPVKVDSGSRIFAGGRQVGGAIELTVIKSVSQSYLTQLWNEQRGAPSSAHQARSLADTISNYFTPAVLSIAAVTAVVWTVIDSSRAIDAATAVLIVACPCALALSEPFTLGSALRVFGKNRLFLKSSAVVESLARVRSIVFDKTGTLTPSGTEKIEYDGEELSEGQLSLIASLATQSAHPHSRRISGELHDVERWPVNSYEEVPGQGLKGNVEGHDVRLGSLEWATQNREHRCVFMDNNSAASVHVSVDGVYKGRFRLPQQYRPGVNELVNGLYDKYDLTLLSGDRPIHQRQLRQIFGPKAELKFEQSPFDKLEFVRDRQHTGSPVLIIGDGLNDAGALREASVGLAVAESSSSFTPGCDGILDSRGLPLLPNALKLARRSLNIIKLSYGISIVYNLLGLTFAAQGMLSPLVAAILMPASSVSVVLFSTLATRVAGRQAGLK